MRKGLHSWVTGVLALLLFFFAMHHYLSELEGNYSGFLLISHRFADRCPRIQKLLEKGENLQIYDAGYDGQFFYQIAFDPLLTDPGAITCTDQSCMDYPAYRYRRIAFPLLANVVSAGDPGLFPMTMTYLILLSSFAGAFFLARVAQSHDRSPYFGLLYAIVPAVLFSLRFALPESIAAATLIACFYFFSRERYALSAVCSAFSLLTRETGLVLIFVLFATCVLQKKWKPAVLVVASTAPHFLWRSYLTYRFFGCGGWSGGWRSFYFSPSDWALPFSGMYKALVAINQGRFIQEHVSGAVLMMVLLTGLAILGLEATIRRKSILAPALLLYAGLSLCLNYNQVWLFLGNVERLTYEAFVIAILIFLSDKKQTPIEKYAYAAFFVLLLAYSLFASTVHDAFLAGILPITL